MHVTVCVGMEGGQNTLLVCQYNYVAGYYQVHGGGWDHGLCL